VLASLDRPRVVRLRDFGELQGTFFLALEYIEGADLATQLWIRGAQTVDGVVGTLDRQRSEFSQSPTTLSISYCK